MSRAKTAVHSELGPYPVPPLPQIHSSEAPDCGSVASGSTIERQLFRPEAIAAQQVQWLGTVRLHRPWSYTTTTAVALLMAGALIAFAALGEMHRKTTATGLLLPTAGLFHVASAQAGVVLERRVHEGQAVQAGDVLMVIDSGQRSAYGDTAALVAQQIEARDAALAVEAELRQTTAHQRRTALKDRLLALNREVAQQAEETELQARRVVLAERTLQRHHQLARENFVADAQVQAKQEEWIDVDTRLQSARRQGLALQREAQSLRAESAQIDAQLQTELALVQRNRASVHQESAENAARQRSHIVAPQAGVVANLHLQPGQAVQAGQFVATVMPQGAELEAQLWLPSQKAGFIEPGQRVYMRYAAYPYQKYGLHGGTVLDVASAPSSAEELPRGQANQLLAQAQANEALYRVRVKLDRSRLEAHGRTHELRAGMTLQADVLQERRAIFEWILEPILATHHRIRIPSDDPSKASPGG